MQNCIAKTFVLLLLSGFVHAEETPMFKKQIIQVPMNTVDWVGPYWKDINKDGLIELLVLVQNEKKVFTYVQGSSGFPETLTQTITLPPATMWITLLDVNEHHSDEMLISTSEGLVYYCQNNGVFEIKPEKLIEAEQIVPRNHPPIIIDPNKWPEGSKNTIPIIFSDHSVIYKVNESYQLKPIGTIEHEFKKSIDKDNWNSWNIGSKKSEQLRIRTVAQEKIETNKGEEPKKENEYIEKTIEKIEKNSQWWGNQAIEEKDINADGSKDLVLWYSTGYIEVKTTVIVFIRQKNGKLPEKPNQILRFSGMPINFNNQSSSVSLFYDIDNDGFLEIVLAELKTKPISASSFVEVAVSKGIDWILSIRQFKNPKGYSNDADFKLDVTTALPTSRWIEDLIALKGDFNADGRTDFIVRRSPTQCDIYISSSNSKFYEPQPKLQLQFPSEGRMFVEDLNGDGISDIYVIDYEKGQITVFLSEPLKKKGAFSESR